MSLKFYFESGLDSGKSGSCEHDYTFGGIRYRAPGEEEKFFRKIYYHWFFCRKCLRHVIEPLGGAMQVGVIESALPLPPGGMADYIFEEEADES